MPKPLVFGFPELQSGFDSEHVRFVLAVMTLQQVSSEYFASPYQFSFHPLLHNPDTERYSRGHKLCSHSVVSQHFMEPEGSLPRVRQSSPLLPNSNQTYRVILTQYSL
jgi:hypothetical protein